MTTALRIKTFPELLARMLARAQAIWRATHADDLDLNPGSAYRTVFEAAATNDADAQVQLGKLQDLFSLDNCKGDDVDARALDYGVALFTELLRKKAQTSISFIVAGTSTPITQARFASDATAGATVFTVDDGSQFPTSGAVQLERGTPRDETVVYTRSGNVFTVVNSGGLVNAHLSTGLVSRISIRSMLVANVAALATSATISPGTGVSWAASGTVIFDRGTAFQEKIAFTRAGDVLTLGAPTVYAHSSGSVVIQGTDGADHAITVGTICNAPATESTKQVDFRVQQAGSLLDGDFTSGLIQVASLDVGLSTRVGSNTITRWQTPPFIGATVTNPVAGTRGTDREDDLTYIRRIKAFIQSLTRATPLAITTLVQGLVDDATGETVTSAQIVEPVSPGASDLYISDGSAAFAVESIPFLGRDTVIRDADAGDRRGTLAHFGPFGYSTSAPVTPRLFKSVQRGAATSVGTSYLEDTAQTMTVGAYTGMYLKTDDDQFYSISGNTAVRFFLVGGTTPSLGSYSVFDFASSPLTPGTDFQFNRSNGDLELTTALLAHDGLVAASDNISPSVGAYTYSAGLGAFVQRTVNGDPTAFVTFPGLRASGTQVVVKSPIVIGQTFTIKVVAARGFTDPQIRPFVSIATQTYVNSTGVGENPVLSEIIRLVKGLPGVGDVTIIDPPTNPVVPAGQVMRITDADVVMV